MHIVAYNCTYVLLCMMYDMMYYFFKKKIWCVIFGPIWSIGCLRELVLSTGVGSCGTSWKSTIRIRSGKEQSWKGKQIRSEGMGYQLWAQQILAAWLSHFITNDPFSLLLGQTCRRSWRCSRPGKLPAVVFLEFTKASNYTKIPSLDGLRRVPKCFQYASVIGGLTHLLDFDILILMSNKIN